MIFAQEAINAPATLYASAEHPKHKRGRYCRHAMRQNHIDRAVLIQFVKAELTTSIGPPLFAGEDYRIVFSGERR